MAFVQGAAPSPAGGCAASDTDAPTPRGIACPADLAGSLRDRTRQQVDSGELDIIEADYYFKLANCFEITNTYPINNPAKRDFMGFGPIEPLLNNADDEGHWISLLDAMHVSGMDHDDIQAMFFDDRDDGYRDVYELSWLINADGDRNVILLVQNSFLLRAMSRGPWEREFLLGPLGGGAL